MKRNPSVVSRIIRKMFSYEKILDRITADTYVAGLALAGMADAINYASVIAEEDKLSTEKLERLLDVVVEEAGKLLGDKERILKAVEVRQMS